VAGAPFHDEVVVGGGAFVPPELVDMTCTHPDVPVEDSGPVAATPTVDAQMVVYEFTALEGSDGRLHDYEFDGDELSAQLDVTVYRTPSARLCAMHFDLDGAVETDVDGVVADNGATLWRGWQVELPVGDTDCRAFDGAVTLADPRTLYTGHTVRLAIGESVDSAAAVRSDVGNATYNADYEPYLVGQFVSLDGGPFVESGWAWVHFVTTCDEQHPTLVELASDVEVDIRGVVEGHAEFVFDL
jgi:hypothetical protein